jgi:hypothetical protein
MKRFNHFKEKYPNLTSVVWAAKSVAGMRLSMKQVRDYVKLVERDDCPRNLREGLVRHFFRLTKSGAAEDSKIIA